MEIKQPKHFHDFTTFSLKQVHKHEGPCDVTPALIVMRPPASVPVSLSSAFMAAK